LKNNINILILEAQSGNKEAFHQLVSFHDERVMSLALQLTRNMQDAEDLYQEVFIKAYKSIGSFRLESEFFTWIYRITVNSFFNFKKKTLRLQKQESLDLQKNPKHNISNDSTLTIDKDEVNHAVTKALNQLSIKQKTVFVMKHYEGLKIREISAIMNISDGTVKRYLFRAIEKLRPMLKEYRYD
jgi:RNA polymerase sigma-70 factor (ECF subfamily)